MFTTKVYANTAAVQYGKRLDGERLRRIVEAATVNDAFRMLADYGYAYQSGCSVDGFIVGETDRLIRFISDNAPNIRFANALTARFVYNNAKLAYKSRFAAVPADGYYNTDLDIAKIADGDYGDADGYMAEALTELDENNEKRPQVIDLVLTSAMYKSVLKCGIPAVKHYFRAEIDMKNILTAARMKRLGLSGDEFLQGGTIDADTLSESVDAEHFAEPYEHTRYALFAERIELRDGGELWRAERETDDHLYFMTDSTVTDYSSYKPFLNYYTETLIELKTVKTALVCIKTNSRDEFYDRIPEIYKDI